MERGTLLKSGLVAVAALALVTVVPVLIALVALFWPSSAPAVLPLRASAQFRAYELGEVDDGYVIAGTVGTISPSPQRTCSGRFALVFLDRDGRPRRATVLPGLERSRYCAARLSALVPAWGGGWLVAGTGVRDEGESLLSPSERSTGGVWATVLADAEGAVVPGFGDEGLLTGGEAAGSVAGAAFTRQLERITSAGVLVDDFVVSSGPSGWWTWIVSSGGLLVAVDAIGAEGQTLVREPGSVRTYRPLVRDMPIEVGSYVLSDALLLGETLFVGAADAAGAARVGAFDGRSLQVVRSFANDGFLGLVGDTGPVLTTDAAGRIVAATTTRVNGVDQSIVVHRFAPTGRIDRSFGLPGSPDGMRVEPRGPASDLLSDAEGRTLVLTGDSSIVRLTPDGRLDGSFADDGELDLHSVWVCRLSPARDDPACSES